MAVKQDNGNNNLGDQLQNLVNSDHFKEPPIKLEKEAFDQSITIKVTKSIKDKLEALAISEGSKSSDLIRRAIMAILKNQK